MSYPMKFRLIEVLPTLAWGARIGSKQHLGDRDKVRHSNKEFKKLKCTYTVQ